VGYFNGYPAQIILVKFLNGLDGHWQPGHWPALLLRFGPLRILSLGLDHIINGIWKTL
jgi:hypothetical protein